MKKQTETVIVTGPVRFAYLNVFKARENKAKKKDEYSVTVLIPKVATDKCADPVAEIKDIRSVVKAVCESKFPGITAKAEGEAPKWHTCVKDGDKETNGNGDPKFPGFFFITASASEEYPPKVVGPNKNPISLADKGDWESGDWGKAILSFYAWEYAGKKGVSAGLRAVQFIAHDAHFKRDDADGFDNEAGATSNAEYDPFADE
jgi:hypothetical protein